MTGTRGKQTGHLPKHPEAMVCFLDRTWRLCKVIGFSSAEPVSA
jgi:hypothetical protein